jgi:hypothetical protein
MVKPDYTRRKFIKIGAAGSAYILVHNTCSFSKEVEVIKESPAWKPGMRINPDIDNLRVVCCHDPSMLTHDPDSWKMAEQNAPVVTEKVHKNMDTMAMSLARTQDAQTAWAKIFRKPRNKQWTDTKAAIKVNAIFKNHPRYAVVAKVCHALHSLGMPYANIIIYDAISNAAKHYAEAVGKKLPGRVIVSDDGDALGGWTKVYVARPKERKVKCVKDIAEGKIDILVNIAVNKGMSKKLCGISLTMKNHAGTFQPRYLHRSGSLDYLLAFNQNNAILGGSPVRQQLCIVDSLWGKLGGPWGSPDKRLSRLVMGTFSPAVDYLTAKRIREPLLQANHPNIERFLTDFGYEALTDLDLVNVAPL